MKYRYLIMKDDEELISYRKLRCFSLFLSHKPTMWGTIFSIEGSQQKSLTFIYTFYCFIYIKKEKHIQKIHALDLISLSMIKWAGASETWGFWDLSNRNYSRERGQAEKQISYCSKLMIFIHCARKSNICFNNHIVTINSCFRFWHYLTPFKGHIG